MPLLTIDLVHRPLSVEQDTNLFYSLLAVLGMNLINAPVSIAIFEKYAFIGVTG